MMNVQAKTVATAGVAAIAIVGISGCSSNKPAAQSGTTSATATSSMAAPAMTAATPNPAAVFAPTDAAFGKLAPATVEKLKTDAPLLKSILTYHVMQGQLSPAKVDGTHATLQGANSTVTGQGDDTVLMPPS
ncbi:fasciclin domain-containing protein [Mycobacterium sp. Aquia_216]|uniref:fasciclin domain-containing protein n=1 Tax=Mycobacterium sp. Aquia_216 TaxID=2991729 RepID=UPI002DD6A0A5|nr:fasciclin domain-containing protein [Mycobacterium sp. Aquia_216]